MQQHGFELRSCPLCGSGSRRQVFDLEAAQFCAVNPTYSAYFRTLLRLPADARFPLDDCRGCGLLYARFLPPRDFMARIYEETIQTPECIAGSENPASYARRLRYLADLLALAPARQPLRALDFGCGLGVTLRLLGAVGVEAWGVDPSPSRGAYATGAGARIVTDVPALGERPSFDLLVLDNVLEHLAKPADIVRDLGRVTAPGAVAYVSVPDYGAPMIASQRRAIEQGQALDPTLNPWEHLNYFSLGHLDRLMRVGGFSRLEAERLPHAVDVGLRPEPALVSRAKNAGASVLRLLAYAASGKGVTTAERAFYSKV